MATLASPLTPSCILANCSRPSLEGGDLGRNLGPRFEPKKSVLEIVSNSVPSILVIPPLCESLLHGALTVFGHHSLSLNQIAISVSEIDLLNFKGGNSDLKSGVQVEANQSSHLRDVAHESTSVRDHTQMTNQSDP